MLYQALSTQMPYDEYEEFIDQSHLSLQNLDDAYDYKSKRSSVSSETAGQSGTAFLLRLFQHLSASILPQGNASAHP